MERVRKFMKKELLKGLTEEQIAKVKACKNSEELLKLAKEEGIELSDEQLEAISGGGCNSISGVSCPKCGSKYVDKLNVYDGVHYTCRKCYHSWIVSNNK